MTEEEALQRLCEEGYKYTGKREEMIHYMAQENRFLPAKKVMEHLKQEYPGMSFDTVYRNLALFEELGIVEETEMAGERWYRLLCEKEPAHHHHFICVECGQTVPVAVCPVSERLQLPAGYEVTEHRFELYGRCPKCRA